jgi:hypothetical protein
MSWTGISLVRVSLGQTAEDAVAATIGGWLTVTEDGMASVPNPRADAPEPSAENDRWMDEVVQLLTGANARLRTAEEQFDDGPGHHRRWITLDDDDGPIWFAVYPGEVLVTPARGDARFDDEVDDPFATMWRMCQLLAREAGCVAYDADEDELVDLSLDLDQARTRYLWM